MHYLCVVYDKNIEFSGKYTTIFDIHKVEFQKNIKYHVVSIFTNF